MSDDLELFDAAEGEAPEGPAPIELSIDEAWAGQRLDKALAELLPDVSRALVQKHIEGGHVTIDGVAPKHGARTALKAGQRVRYAPPAPEPVALVAEDIPLAVLFEDEHLIVIDKPANLVVHPTPAHPRGTLVNAVLFRVKDLGGIGGELRPGIVHRLDRDTTGVIVVAKHDRAQRRLAEMFKARKVEKRYLAVVVGVPRPPSRTLETMYGRHPRDRKKFSSKVMEGKAAITHFTTIRSFVGAAFLEVRIDTGRTHQIRVHLSDLGHPLVGDTTYGRRTAIRDPRTKDVIARFHRPALHAQRLAFEHPMTGEPLVFEAPIPEDLAELISALTEASR